MRKSEIVFIILSKTGIYIIVFYKKNLQMPPNPRHTTEICNGIYDTHTQCYYSSMLKPPGHELRQVSGVRRQDSCTPIPLKIH